jgi:mevalonate kinase
VNEDPNIKTYRSNGKLLITGEYVVLEGAKALALPTKYGQSLSVTPNNSNTINWKSYNELNELWFKDSFTFTTTNKTLRIDAVVHNDISKRLISIFKAIKTLNPEFLKTNTGFDIETHQDFNRLWGLGTSSTLIANLANWTGVDAYALLKLTFGGSGYDIACAMATRSVSYQLPRGNADISFVTGAEKPIITDEHFNPTFSNHLYFVYLNQKQNSRDGIAQYKKNRSDFSLQILEINKISEAMISCDKLTEFQQLMNRHEEIISKIIKQPTIKSILFDDFKGSVKSLGAWGGDFALIASDTNPKSYFKNKGFNTVITYSNMIKN